MDRLKKAREAGESTVRTDVPAVVLPYKKAIVAKPVAKRRVPSGQRVAAAR
jgi:hypothetical protein